MLVLSHSLERTLVVPARADVLFSYFSETPRWAAWWGAGSSIEARAGGTMHIRHPNGVEVGGGVVECLPPSRIVFTYGYPGGAPIPAGGSRVTVTITPTGEGARLVLRHDLADEHTRDELVQGWRFHLSVLANLLGTGAAAQAESVVDGWFSVWSEPDATVRNQALDALVSAGVRFEDRFSRLAGIEDVRAHLGAVHRFMPGLRMERSGPVRQCQWHLLADWVARGADGTERGRGTNLFVIDQDGRIGTVTGFWTASLS